MFVGENRLNIRATGVSLKPIRIALLSILSLFFLSASVKAQNAGKPNLEYVLSMMDRSAEDFKSLTAAIEHIKDTAVVKDTSTESGEIFVRKDAKMRIDFQAPDPRTIIRNGDNLYIYTPKINRVEEYNIGKNRVMADQYLALGFGTRIEALRKNYSISLAGEEELEGHKTAVIELAPRNEEVRRQISKIAMWVDESSWLPIQQKFFEASGAGDYFMSRYTKVMKNLKLGDGKFKPDWPKGTRIEKPRG
jgi:outer membrane lipoprotein-sorting protein